MTLLNSTLAGITGGLIGTVLVEELYESLEKDNNLHLFQEICFFYIEHNESKIGDNRLLFNSALVTDESKQYYIGFKKNTSDVEKYINNINDSLYTSSIVEYQPPLQIIKDTGKVIQAVNIDLTFKYTHPELFKPSTSIPEFNRAVEDIIDKYVLSGYDHLIRTIITIPLLYKNKEIIYSYMPEIFKEWSVFYKCTPNLEEYTDYSKLMLIYSICEQVMKTDDFITLYSNERQPKP